MVKKLIIENEMKAGIEVTQTVLMNFRGVKMLYTILGKAQLVHKNI